MKEPTARSVSALPGFSSGLQFNETWPAFDFAALTGAAVDLQQLGVFGGKHFQPSYAEASAW